MAVNTDWSISENRSVARFSFVFIVANIFLATRKDVMSKWGSSTVSGKDKARDAKVVKGHGSLEFVQHFTSHLGSCCRFFKILSYHHITSQ